MGNEVKIKVTADNDTNRTWSDIRGEYSKLATDAKKFGMDAGKNFGGAISDSASKAAAAMPQILAGAAIVAAPLVGGVIAGAIIGGVGIGAAGLGVVLVAQNPEVQAAGKKLGASLKSGLQADASSFIEPVLKQIDKIGTAFQDERGKIRNIFSGSAGFLDPLVDGALHGIDSILSGVDSLIARGGPVIKSFGNAFGTLGDSIDVAFTAISGSSDGAARSIDEIAAASGRFIEVTGFVIAGLAKIESWLGKTDDAIDSWRHSLEDALSFGDNAGTQFDITADGMSNLERKAKEAADAQTGLAQANNDLLPTIGSCVAAVGQNADAATIAAGATAKYAAEIANASGPLGDLTAATISATSATRSLWDTATKVGEAEDNLSDSIKKNGKTLDAHTEKGRANRTALSGLASALNASYKAYVDVNGAGSAANKIAGQNYNAFIKTATGAGISERAAKNYARQLGLIPPKKQTDFTANTHDAAGRISALQDQVNGLHGKNISVHVSVTGLERLNAAGHRIGGYMASGGIKGAAAGTNTGGLTWVGEQGPELADLPAGSRVWSHGDSVRMAKQMSGGNGPISIVVRPAPGADSAHIQWVLENLRFEIAGQGGDVQSVLGRSY